ncbi:aldehyde dehydrogenase family protein [Niveispirillum cyanobacteriorum]|uniref:Aldehyde dehydrogenase n=1 Tax=Niveispirillum cyanobacteriorum TaxID=1612173 RepID=A0A2K9NDM9_9PROT|nr:aldehyde dehydrogenase family protein [Niveispirillum cyanobacteriorum]AUN31197.1 aldehyde dehydrogenase [Niveispirillum cyanobacteriorum]GGE86497.1 aldehyde dehydrogenase [Niveispirillum cyanobacteriorum]
MEIPVRNPRTGQIDHRINVTNATTIAALAARLRLAQKGWRALGLEGRAVALRRFGDALERHRDALAAALAVDTGRNRIARMEVDGVRGSIAGWIAATQGVLPDGWVQARSNSSIRHAPHWVPYDLVGVISPWNFPLTLSMIDAIPALLAGCSVMVKPSEVTPRFIQPLNAAIVEAGLSHVLALVPGDGTTGQALIDAVDCVCFTGSVPTGRKVAVRAAERLIPSFLELGGKDPLIVLDGANLEDAVTAALRGSVLSTGQACQSIERIYVAAPVHDAFVRRLTDAAMKVRINTPDIGQGELGPIIFDRQADILRRQIADAVARGARVLTGGVVEDHGGLWLRPTVLTQVTHDMEVMREETFGPILPVMAFDSVEQAIALANDSQYGLSAAVFAADLEQAAAVARRLVAGAISLNDAALTALFHEAPKQSFRDSGLGPSRMGLEGYTRFFRRQALIAQMGRPLPLSAFAEDAGEG